MYTCSNNNQFFELFIYSRNRFLRSWQRSFNILWLFRPFYTNFSVESYIDNGIYITLDKRSETLCVTLTCIYRIDAIPLKSQSQSKSIPWLKLFVNNCELCHWNDFSRLNTSGNSWMDLKKKKRFQLILCLRNMLKAPPILLTEFEAICINILYKWQYNMIGRKMWCAK